MKVLVTGAAGFIGFHTTCALLARGDAVIGIDNLNDYYDPGLKAARLSQIQKLDNSGLFKFQKTDLCDADEIGRLFDQNEFDAVINLAAQAGVRYGEENPRAYVDSNIMGFLNILEGCRYSDVKHLVYASSSSVYGANEELPYSENHSVDHPLSLYGATKKANELFAHSYSNLYGISTTGLRFFTVYGPWGRPDMALFIFSKAILEGKPIEIFNEGKHLRDFTFIDDIVEGVIRVLDHPAVSDEDWTGMSPVGSSSRMPWRIYNIGNGQPVNLLDCIDLLEKKLGRVAKRIMRPIQSGDVRDTHADLQILNRTIGYKPKASFEEGVSSFVDWYCDYYGISL